MKKRYAAMATGVAATAAFALAFGGTAFATDYKYSQEFDTRSGNIKVEADGSIFQTGGMIGAVPLNADGSASTIHCRVTVPAGSKLEEDQLGFTVSTNNDVRYLKQSWDRVGDGVYEGSMTTDKCGNYGLYIPISEGFWDHILTFNYTPAPPIKMKITSYHDKIIFDPSKLETNKNGYWTVIVANGEMYTLRYPKVQQLTKLEAGKKYNILLSGAMENEKGNLSTGYAKTFSVPMGPKTKPTIKSVKITKVKVKKYFNYQDWKYKYKTRYTFKVTLGKKASKTKGAYIQIKGTNGLLNAYRTLKGTGKTFSSTIEMDAPVSYKGGKVKFTAMTYSDNTYDAYSPESKAKTVKIK